MPHEKVLVTGATGFIGSHLAKSLVEAGYEVRALVREKNSDRTRLSGVDVEFVVGDIRQADSLFEAASKVKKVFHCAAVASDWASKQAFYETNVVGTENILKACVRENVGIFIGISTNDVFGRIEKRVVDESFPLMKWHEPYPDTKLLAEKLIWKYHETEGLPVTLVYPCWVYGEGDTTFLPHIIKAIASRQLVFWRKNALMWPTFIENLIDLLHVISTDTRAIGNGYLVHDGNSVSFENFCNRICDETGLRRIKTHIPYVGAYVSAVIIEMIWRLLSIRDRPPLTTYVVKNIGSRHQYSIEKARNELDWIPKKSFEQGFAQTMAWASGAFDLKKGCHRF
jgi:2-alkyl-3-oxoalkanoate reductase